MLPTEDPLLQAQRGTGEEKKFGTQIRSSLEGTSHTEQLQVYPREGPGKQWQQPSRQNLCSAAGGMYILDILMDGYIFLKGYIYIPSDGLCPTQQEKIWCSPCSCVCSVSLCWSLCGWLSSHIWTDMCAWRTCSSCFWLDLTWAAGSST